METPYWLKKADAHSKRAETLRIKAARTGNKNDLAQARGEERAASECIRKWRKENPTADRFQYLKPPKTLCEVFKNDD